MKHGNSTHGMSDKAEYNSWVGIKQRCNNPNNNKYHRYGFRGIKVCPRWLNSFELFLKDMGSKPTNCHSIDRVDNNGNYEPSNCKWSNQKQQQNNKSTNHFLTLDGKTKTIAQWAESLEMSQDVIFARKKLGWSDRDALLKLAHERVVKGKGVTKTVSKKGIVRWKAFAYKNNKRIHLGSLKTEEEALIARSNYERKISIANG